MLEGVLEVFVYILGESPLDVGLGLTGKDVVGLPSRLNSARPAAHAGRS